MGRRGFSGLGISLAGLVSLASSVTASATGASLTASGLASGSAGTGSMLTGASFSVVVIFVNKWSEIWSRAVGSSLPRSVWSASGESGLSLRRVGASWKSGAVVRGKTCARLCRRDASDGSRGHLVSSRCFSGTQNTRGSARTSRPVSEAAAASASPSSVFPRRTAQRFERRHIARAPSSGGV